MNRIRLDDAKVYYLLNNDKGKSPEKLIEYGDGGVSLNVYLMIDDKLRAVLEVFRKTAIEPVFRNLELIGGDKYTTKTINIGDESFLIDINGAFNKRCTSYNIINNQDILAKVVYDIDEAELERIIELFKSTKLVRINGKKNEEEVDEMVEDDPNKSTLEKANDDMKILIEKLTSWEFLILQGTRTLQKNALVNSDSDTRNMDMIVNMAICRSTCKPDMELPHIKNDNQLMKVICICALVHNDLTDESTGLPSVDKDTRVIEVDKETKKTVVVEKLVPKEDMVGEISSTNIYEFDIPDTVSCESIFYEYILDSLHTHGFNVDRARIEEEFYGEDNTPVVEYYIYSKLWDDYISYGMTEQAFDDRYMKKWKPSREEFIDLYPNDDKEIDRERCII